MWEMGRFQLGAATRFVEQRPRWLVSEDTGGKDVERGRF